MQTQVQNEKSIRMGSGVLFINDVNVGLLKNAKLEMEFETISISADNGKLPPIKRPTKDGTKFSAELYEIKLDMLRTVDAHGVLSSVAASPVTVTAEIMRASGTWKSGEVIYLAHANGDNSKITPITLKNGSSALTADTDYAIVTVNGKTGVARIGADLTLTGIGLNAGYTYTPNASERVTYSDLAKAIGYYKVEFVNTNALGKKFGITIPQWYSSSNISLSFQSDEKIDEAMTMPFEVIASPNSANELLIIDDEQSV